MSTGNTWNSLTKPDPPRVLRALCCG